MYFVTGEIMLNISFFSTQYTVKKLVQADVDAIYLLCCGNPLFYEYCPPDVTKESIAQDMQALPSGKSYDDKYYLGFWKGDTLVAVLDLILNYPNCETAFVGFFMIEQKFQKQGIGSQIIEELCQHLKKQGYSFVRLGYAKGNSQSRKFWLKNHFDNVGVEYQTSGYTVVVLQREL